MYDTAEKGKTVRVEKTGEFNTAHVKYVDKRIAARHTHDGSGLQAAYEECKNKGQALRDHYLLELDLEDCKQIDESLSGLEREHDELLRELKGR